jgi:ankyrin repeat protein
MLAAYYGFDDCVDALLKHGAPVNAQSVCGQTALMRAVGSGSLSTIQLLLASGINRALRTNSGLSALDIALAIKSDDDIINVLEAVDAR